MDSRNRLISALDTFAQRRRKGSLSKKHVVPLVEFAAAEFRGRGVDAGEIKREKVCGRYYKRKVDLVVETRRGVEILVFIITQSGSVRKNLNNRRRDIIGDSVNLRAAHPNAKLGLIYLLRSDREATRRSKAGTSPIDELALFFQDLLAAGSQRAALLDAAALLAADCDAGGRIRIEKVPDDVDVLGNFFGRLLVPASA
jgi:hypothetical protein